MTPDLVPSDDEDDDVVDAELLDDDAGEPIGGTDLGDLLGSLGGLDMSDLLDSAMQMQQDLLDAQAEVADAEFEGQSGGGVVRIVVTGSLEFRSVTIAPEVVDPDDVEMLQDLVLAALHDATGQAVSAAASSMPSVPGMDLLGGLTGGGGLGDLDFGALFGGSGGAPDDGPIIDGELADFDEDLVDVDDGPDDDGPAAPGAE